MKRMALVGIPEEHCGCEICPAGRVDIDEFCPACGCYVDGACGCYCAYCEEAREEARE